MGDLLLAKKTATLKQTQLDARKEFRNALMAIKRLSASKLKKINERLSNKKTNIWNTNMFRTFNKARCSAPVYTGPCKNCDGQGYTRSIWDFFAKRSCTSCKDL